MVKGKWSANKKAGGGFHLASLFVVASARSCESHFPNIANSAVLALRCQDVFADMVILYLRLLFESIKLHFKLPP
jgi:hypothetical protein